MSSNSDPYGDLASRYAHYAAMEREVCRRLLERVEHRQVEPRRILCLGAGDGQAPAALKKQFRKAQVIVADASPAMLSLAAARSTLLRPFRRLCCLADALPLADRSIDLVFSNLAGHWRCDGERLMTGFRRVLRPGGMLLFSSLGIGSLASLVVDHANGRANPGFPLFEDILRAGDLMMSAGFREPVMDSDRIALSYPDLAAMCEELEGTGRSLEAGNWPAWKQYMAENPGAVSALTRDGRIHLDYEIIYGAAFAPEDGQPLRSGGSEVATFSVDSLLKTARK